MGGVGETKAECEGRMTGPNTWARENARNVYTKPRSPGTNHPVDNQEVKGEQSYTPATTYRCMPK